MMPWHFVIDTTTYPYTLAGRPDGTTHWVAFAGEYRTISGAVREAARLGGDDLRSITVKDI